MELGIVEGRVKDLLKVLESEEGERRMDRDNKEKKPLPRYPNIQL